MRPAGCVRPSREAPAYAPQGKGSATGNGGHVGTDRGAASEKATAGAARRPVERIGSAAARLRPDAGRSRPAVDAATKLTPGAGLTLSLLLSLGLWAAIWQAVFSLAAAC